MSTFDEAVQRVKDMQRSNPEGKEAWIYWTRENGEGKRDPRAHDESFIHSFFEAFESGSIGGMGGMMDDFDNFNDKELFVGGLPKGTTESAIYDYFGTFGVVMKVDFKPDKGYCFVHFDDDSAVREILQFADKHVIMGKWIDCKRVTKNNKGGKGYGKGGGWGGYGGGWGNDYGGWGGGYGKGKGSFGSKGKGGGGKKMGKGKPY